MRHMTSAIIFWGLLLMGATALEAQYHTVWCKWLCDYSGLGDR